MRQHQNFQLVVKTTILLQYFVIIILNSDGIE